MSVDTLRVTCPKATTKGGYLGAQRRSETGKRRAEYRVVGCEMTAVTKNRPSAYEKEFARVVHKTLGYSAKSNPSRSATAVLALLADLGVGEGLWGSEIARRIGQGQSNTTKLTLPRLQEMGLIEFREQTNPRGGRPLHIWRLTEKGRDIGILASVESRSGIHSAQRSDSVSSVPGQSRVSRRRTK